MWQKKCPKIKKCLEKKIEGGEMTDEQRKYVYDKMQTIAQGVERQVPGYGFVVLVFPFGEGEEDEPEMNYVSNARRKDILAVMREFIAKTAIGGQFKD